MATKFPTIKRPVGSFIVHIGDSQPPICLLSSRYCASPTPEPPPFESDSKTPKARQFPKTMIRTLKHEARSLSSIMSTQPTGPRVRLVYPQHKDEPVVAERDWDQFTVVNGRIRRKESGSMELPRNNDLDWGLQPYSTRVSFRPDLASLREMQRSEKTLRARLRRLNQQLQDFSDKSYLLPNAKTMAAVKSEIPTAGPSSPKSDSNTHISFPPKPTRLYPVSSLKSN